MEALGTARVSAARRDELSVARHAAFGDREAFEWIARRHYPRLFRLARAALNDDLDAEAALQDAYLSAYQALVRFRGEASLSTWLSRILLNECAAHWRRECRRRSMVPMLSLESETAVINAIADPDAQPDDSLSRAQTHATLVRKIRELPAALRRVFVMRSVEELSVAKTAQSLGITEEAVRARHFRARHLLRGRLAPLVEAAPARQLRIAKSSMSPTAGCEGGGLHPYQVTNAQQACRFQADR